MACKIGSAKTRACSACGLSAVEATGVSVKVTGVIVAVEETSVSVSVETLEVTIAIRPSRNEFAAQKWCFFHSISIYNLGDFLIFEFTYISSLPITSGNVIPLT